MSQISVLVVEDEIIVSKDIQNSLKRLGYTIVGSAASGDKAIEAAIKTKPDIILMDIMLKGEMNGIEATQEIRKIRGDIPIIAQTAFIFEQDQQMILGAGCDACLMKPIRKDQLISVISTFFGKN